MEGVELVFPSLLAKESADSEMSREIFGTQSCGHIFDTKSVRPAKTSYNACGLSAGSGSFASLFVSGQRLREVPRIGSALARPPPGWKKVSWGGGQSLRSLLTCADRKAGGWQLSKPNSAQREGFPEFLGRFSKDPGNAYFERRASPLPSTHEIVYVGKLG